MSHSEQNGTNLGTSTWGDELTEAMVEKPLVILITGQAGAGKTTLARALMDTFCVFGISSENIRFSDPVYAMHDAALRALDEFHLARLGKRTKNAGTKNRRLLQLIGTEWGRQSIGENVWIDIFLERLRASSAQVVIADDCRFLNERNAVVGSGFPTLTVGLRGTFSPIDEKDMAHASESSTGLIPCNVALSKSESVMYRVSAVIEAIKTTWGREIQL